MNKINKIKIAICAIITFATLQIQAQTQVQITGTVIDASPQDAYFHTDFVTIENGQPIADALVQIKFGDNLLASYRALTDAEGRFGTAQTAFRAAAIDVSQVGDIYLVVRKAGYLPDTTLLDNLEERVINISLVRDPIELRIDSVMAMMNTADKIYQMTQPLARDGANLGGPYGLNGHLYGSVLRGGDGHAGAHLRDLPATLASWSGNVRIPVYYGKDAVHGNAGIAGYTVFPHNIALGATRDSALVRRIGAATAKEMWAAGINLNFSPAISVAQDPRWGRTFESYGETAELSVMMGAAMVRGLQGDRFDAPWRITATAKHYLADGGTTDGRDRGNTVATDEVLRAVHLPGYEAVVEQGVLSVMASFNTIQNPGGERVHQHVDSLRLTGWLKTELAFDGYVISDWDGIANSTQPGFTQEGYGAGACRTDRLPSLNPTAHALTQEAVRRAINAGVDHAMEPTTAATFITYLTTLVNSNQVPMTRIDDAVRRILRAKFRAGIMDDISVAGPSQFLYNTANRASVEHRAIAREAVAKSQVLLRNDGAVLPLAKDASIHVFGSHSNDISLQSGGWTITWQGGRNNADFAGIGTSIIEGMRQVSGQSSFATAANADVIVYVTGEDPTYAEWCGDVTTLDFSAPSADMTALRNYREQGKKVVTIFVTGRPRAVPALVEASDAFLVAWLPGTEGGGVADVVFGEMPFSGRLPFTWENTPRDVFVYDFGLITPTTPNAPVLVSMTENTVTLLHNISYEYSNDNGATWQTSAVFENLENETEYQFIQRIRAIRSASGEPSAASDPLVIETASTSSIQEIEREIVDNVEEVVIVAPPSSNIGMTFSAGPNPVDRQDGVVNFYVDGNAEISRGDFVIYDVSGNVVRRLTINNTNIITWNLQDSRGRLVNVGTYLVRGNITTQNGERVNVSTLVRVR